MTLKFYFDTHIAKSVADQLRTKGVDVLRCEEVGLAEASDETLLEYAVANGYAMVSMDEDFRDWHFKWIAEGKSHLGIFKVSHALEGERGIGQIVKELATYHALVADGAASLEADIHNELFFIR